MLHILTLHKISKQKIEKYQPDYDRFFDFLGFSENHHNYYMETLYKDDSVEAIKYVYEMHTPRNRYLMVLQLKHYSKLYRGKKIVEWLWSARITYAVHLD